jgi:hypothetical protein
VGLECDSTGTRVVTSVGIEWDLSGIRVELEWDLNSDFSASTSSSWSPTGVNVLCVRVCVCVFVCVWIICVCLCMLVCIYVCL